MPTFKQCVDTHGALLQAELDGRWSFLGGRVNRTRWRVDFPGGSWIQFFGAENADAARGLRCDFVSPDECDDTDQSVFEAIVQPWFSEPWSLGITLASGTPRRGRYGLLYKLWRLGQDGVAGFHSFHATYRDVPENVSQEYVERLRAVTSPELFAREWEANEDAAEGLVYSIFREAFHVRPPVPETRWNEILIGVDHGYEDPGVFVVCGVAGQGKDAAVHVLEEHYRTHKTEEYWVSLAAEVDRRFSVKGTKPRWYADPSQPARIEAIRRVGCRVEPAANAIDDGVSAVADRLVVRHYNPLSPVCTGCGGTGCALCRATTDAQARLYVSPECKNTIAEFGEYRRRRDPRNRERVTDDIEDKNNHAMDALRYAIFSRFGAPPRTRTEFGPGY
jgi:hypothetical protein